MSKHTQGPWIPACTCNSATHRHPAILSDHGQVAIATFQGSEAATDEIARLIAAAPDLLAAAKLVIAWYEAEDDHSKADFYQRMEMCRTSEAATRAAIAKAEGATT
jgi:hypothetical protein